jgi:type III pantothenate kinase
MNKGIKNLVIDIGNSRVKSGCFTDGKLADEVSSEDLQTCLAEIEGWTFDQVVVSSVKWNEEELKAILPFSFLFFNHLTPLPIKNSYDSPKTLGLDRLAAVVGAWNKSSNGPLITIDIGTCITYDLLNSKNEFVGGAISPGLDMRAEAMHRQTARLPKVDIPSSAISFVGTNTVGCLQSGVYFGVYEEIKGFIKRFKQTYPMLKVFICGGDANYFESLTKDHIFVIPNLVLYGLDRILTYNVEK